MEYSAARLQPTRSSSAVAEVAERPARRGQTHRRQDRAQRGRRRRIEADVVAELAAESAPTFDGREARSRPPSGRSPRRSCARASSNEGVRIDGRGADRPPPAVRRGRRHPHGPRLRPVPAGRDPGAQRRHPRHAAAWTRCSTRSASTTKKRYMHHYNMPPYSNGETGRMRRPEAPRDRPRPARRAGPAAGACRPWRSSPYTLRARVRGAVVQRLDLDGVGVRARRCR